MNTLHGTIKSFVYCVLF